MWSRLCFLEQTLIGDSVIATNLGRAILQSVFGGGFLETFSIFLFENWFYVWAMRHARGQAPAIKPSYWFAHPFGGTVWKFLAAAATEPVTTLTLQLQLLLQLRLRLCLRCWRSLQWRTCNTPTTACICAGDDKRVYSTNHKAV